MNFLETIIDIDSVRKSLIELYMTGEVTAYQVAKNNGESKSLRKYQLALKRLEEGGIIEFRRSLHRSYSYSFSNHPSVELIIKLIELHIDEAINSKKGSKKR